MSVRACGEQAHERELTCAHMGMGRVFPTLSACPNLQAGIGNDLAVPHKRIDELLPATAWLRVLIGDISPASANRGHVTTTEAVQLQSWSSFCRSMTSPSGQTPGATASHDCIFQRSADGSLSPHPLQVHLCMNVWICVCARVYVCVLVYVCYGPRYRPRVPRLQMIIDSDNGVIYKTPLPFCTATSATDNLVRDIELPPDSDVHAQLHAHVRASTYKNPHQTGS